jgi:hypothetical protein
MGGAVVGRRRFMQAALGGVGVVSLTPAAALAAGSRSVHSPFNEAVLAAFKKHRLVGFGETHGLQEHHDALQGLIWDPRLPDHVNDIVVEFGNALYQPTIDRFIAGHPVNDVDLRPVWRNTTQSPVGTWDEPVYEQFFRTVRAANRALPKRRKIRVLLGDPAIDWSKIKTFEQIRAYGAQRDSHAAKVIKSEVLDKGRRALICYGWGHLVRGGSLAGLIKRQTGERTYSIVDLVPLDGDPGGLAKKLAGYQRNTVIPTQGTWLGSFDAGLMPPSLEGGPGSAPKNPWCGVRLGSVIDAGLYMAQPEDLTASWPNPSMYLDPVYWKELQRRNDLHRDPINLDTYRQEHPASFALQKLPASQECAAAGH